MLKALRRSGRFNVTTAVRPRCSYRTSAAIA
jgi:hypothetical protein